MVREHDHPAALAQTRWAAHEQRVKAFEFVVDRNTERLKSSRCRMYSAAPVAAEHTLDQSTEFAGGFNRTAPAGLDDGARDAPRRMLFAIFMDDAREFGLGLLVDDVVGAQLLAPIHTHVERSVEAEAEPPIGVVERKAAHAKVGDDRADARNSTLIED